jgi:hypothetical protein
MKNIFQITEQEKKEILEKHNLFKKVLKSKSEVKRLMVNEQSTPTSGGGVEFLIAARDKGCQIAKGAVLKGAPGKATVLYKRADYDSPNGYFKIGDELYIKDNFTFDVVTTDVDGKKTVITNRRWNCPALTAPAEQEIKKLSDNILKEKKDKEGWMEYSELIGKGYSQLEADQGKYTTEQFTLKNGKVITLYKPKTGSVMGGQQQGMSAEQQAFITRYELKGGKLKLTPEEQASQRFKQILVPGSKAVTGWQDTGLKMYFSVDVIKDIAGESGDLRTTVENQIIPLNECKEFVDQWFTAYQNNTELTPDSDEFATIKDKVQRCKALYSPNPRTGRKNGWGMFSDQKNKIDILSGLVTNQGPSSYGETSKWRLK